jgi:uncharacterized protein YlxW (UPF0749 family)
MDDLLKSIILTLVAMAPGIAALLLGLRKARAEADKEEADASQKITNSALSLVEPLKARIADLEEEVRALRLEVGKLRHEQTDLICGADQLIGQLKALGETPVWKRPTSSVDVPTRPRKPKKGEPHG